MDAFVDATEEHALELGVTLRTADALECVRMGLESVDAPLVSLRQSHMATTWMVDGRVGAMAGLVFDETLMGPRTAQVWCLTSIVVDSNPMAFWRASKRIVAEVGSMVGIAWQRVDAEHAACLRWVRALGFDVYEAEKSGPLNSNFHLVIKRF